MNTSNTEFTRGMLAKHSKVNAETIRYYEKIGLMPEPLRSPGGHRIYNTSHLQRLSFIRRCRELGFALSEIRGLLALVDGGSYTCGEVRDLTVVALLPVFRDVTCACEVNAHQLRTANPVNLPSQSEASPDTLHWSKLEQPLPNRSCRS